MLDVLVTGAGGFIGQALCSYLRTDGRNVLGLLRADGDVTDPLLWERLPPARAVMHLAARSYVPDSWKAPARFLATNVDGTQHALDWCRRHGARMVFSSAYVYGIPSRLPICESDPVRPNNPYALSKYLGEQCCEFAARYLGVDATVLRVFNVFGRGQRGEFLLPTLVTQLTGNEIRVRDLTPRRDYIYLPDVIEAFVRALDTPAGFHCLNIGSGKSYSVDEIVAALQAAAGTELPVVTEVEPRPQEIPDVRADIRLAGEVLGWKPRFDLVAGIDHMMKR